MNLCQESSGQSVQYVDNEGINEGSERQNTMKLCCDVSDECIVMCMFGRIRNNGKMQCIYKVEKEGRKGGKKDRKGENSMDLYQESSGQNVQYAEDDEKANERKKKKREVEQNTKKRCWQSMGDECMEMCISS